MATTSSSTTVPSSSTTFPSSFAAAQSQLDEKVFEDELIALVHAWSNTDRRNRQKAMARIMAKLKSLYDLNVVNGKKFKSVNEEDDRKTMNFLDRMITTTSIHLTKDPKHPSRMPDEKDLKTQRKIKNLLWRQINTHQLDLYRNYDLQVLKPKLGSNVNAAIDNIPLEENMTSLAVSDEEEEDVEEQQEDNDDEENEGDSDGDSYAEGDSEDMTDDDTDGTSSEDEEDDSEAEEVEEVDEGEEIDEGVGGEGANADRKMNCGVDK